MANILLIDESDVAIRAMKGTLTRAGHRLVAVSKALDGWQKLRELVKIDLIFCEVKLADMNGISFLGQLRSDPFLKEIPLVFYTSVMEQSVVKKALELHIQNYLVKPYHDNLIYAEIAKALANPWRNLLFEEEKSFCAQMGFTAATLRHMREKVIDEIDRLILLLPECARSERQPEIKAQLDVLNGDSEAAGIWGLVEYTTQVVAKTEVNKWSELQDCVDELEFAKRMIFCQVHPDILPQGFLSDDEKKTLEETAERDRWMDADVLKYGCLVTSEGVFAKLATVTECPAIDSACASFAMYADGQATHMSHLADVVAKDPGLATQMLISANKIEREGMNAVEDPRLAISLLGELRLNAISKTLVHIEDRHWQAPPFTWPHYWMFLMGVAHMAQYTCRQMEFKLAEPVAFTAGLIHDIGKLLLAHLYPFALPAMLAHSKRHDVSLHTAETRYMGTTCRAIAEHWALQSTLSPSCKSVIRWVESPSKAEADIELVAAVSLARLLCLHNHVGYSGDTPKDTCPPIEMTEAWQVLRERVFPSFQLAAFEREVHAHCRGLKIELQGRLR